MKRILLIGIAVLLGSTAPVAGRPADPGYTEILSPPDGARIPREGDLDPPCDADGYCTFTRVHGRISKGYWPFLAARPEDANPRIWIDDLILDLAPDGSFTADVGIGAAENGRGLHYDILIIGHRRPDRFAADQIQFGIPEECVPVSEATATSVCIVSQPVTILRTR